MKCKGFLLVDTLVALMLLGITATLVTKAISSSVNHLSRAETSLAKERIKRNYLALLPHDDYLISENLSVKKSKLIRDKNGVYLQFLDDSAKITNITLEAFR